MPELPEVQTIVDDLRNLVRGWTVADFCSVWERNVHVGDVQSFKQGILGKKIENVSRRAKYILIELEGDKGILVHLRMTGALLVSNQPPTIKNQKISNIQSPISNLLRFKHVRHWWVLKQGKKEKHLAFSDIRKFGTIDLVELKTFHKHKKVCGLGVEPLNREFTSKVLKNILEKKSSQAIRSVLLDQRLVCGIGNIYVSEILFDAKIDPKRKAGKISKAEASKLSKSIKKVLSKAIEFRGTTFSDYRDSKGERGCFQNKLKVYNREHGRCLRKGCQGIVVKRKINQRSAYWCPECQR